jgi:hypothetical protein
MKAIRKAISALGGIFLAALLIAALAPKAAQAVAAALIRDEDQPARHPFTIACEVDSPSFSGICSFTVPAGGELVIEAITVDGSADTTNKLLSSFLQVVTAGSEELFTLNPIADNGSLEPSGSDFQAVQTARFYADAGSTVTFAASTPATNQRLTVFYRVSGYIVSLP